ncbi:MAG: type IV pilus secretin PilQ [Alcanivoracaceae bacterium]|nr:type IV pilus secretin PilQ [Alcanivoracaceae bacterium]
MKILVDKYKTIETLNVKTGFGNRMKSKIYKHNKLSNILFALVLIMVSSSIWAQLNLESVDYNSKLDGSVEFTFTFDGNIAKPEVFITSQPVRLAFDMVGVLNRSGVKLLPISEGNTKSIRIVSTNQKTRAVIDLFKAAHHELETDGNVLVVKVFGNKKSTLVANQLDRSYSIENIDFRRGSKGQGKVIIVFNKPGVIINLRETADKIKLVINSTNLPSEFDNKLDVIDFATPISFIDTRARNGNVNIEISANGKYEHFAYQTGSQYVVEVIEKIEEVDSNAQSLEKEVEYVGNKVSFNFQDIPVRSVLQLIADASQLNLVVADTVQGNVTLRLNNVPWDQALDIVLNSKQLDKRQKNNVIWIAPAKEIADREQQKLLALKDKEEFEPLRTIFIQVNYAKAEELAELLSGGEGSDEGGILSARGSVTFEERTNILLVSDVPDRLLVVENLIKALDVAVKQVQIETRIVVATDDFGDELGVRFGVNGSKEDSHGNIISTGGSLAALDRLNSAAINNRLTRPSGSGLPNFTPGINGAPIIGPSLGERLNVNLPSVSGNASKWAFSILAADYLLDLELSALETEGRGEVVSTPRVVATNQKLAKIKQGVEIPFEQATSSGATSIIFKEAVLSLEVTPLITPDDRVDLTLKVNKDSIGENVPTSLGGSIPSIDTRSIETRVLVDNGQTIVLGGIYEQTRRTDRSKVPILGDIPGIGALFRNKAVQNDKSELLIFVTPTIIKESL